MAAQEWFSSDDGPESESSSDGVMMTSSSSSGDDRSGGVQGMAGIGLTEVDKKSAAYRAAELKSRRELLHGRDADEIYGRSDDDDSELEDEEYSNEDNVAAAEAEVERYASMTAKQRRQARRQARGRRYPPEVDALIARANECFVKGEYSAMMSTLKDALVLAPTCYEAYNLTALVKKETGHIVEAAQAALMAADLKGTEAGHWEEAGNLADKAARTLTGGKREAFIRSAIAALETSDEIRRTTRWTYRCGELAAEIGLHADAVSRLMPLYLGAERTPIAEQLVLLNRLVPSLEATADTDALIAVLRKFAADVRLARQSAASELPLLSSAAPFITKLVMAYLSQGNVGTAREVVDSHLAASGAHGSSVFSSQNVELNVVNGIVKLHEGKRREAKADFDVLLVREAADYDDLYRMVADAYFRAGLYEDARTVYDQLIAARLDAGAESDRDLLKRHTDCMLKLNQGSAAVARLRKRHRAATNDVNLAVPLVEVLLDDAARAAADGNDDTALSLRSEALDVIDQTLAERQRVHLGGAPHPDADDHDHNPAAAAAHMRSVLLLMLHKATISRLVGSANDYRDIMLPIIATALREDPVFVSAGDVVEASDSSSALQSLAEFGESPLLVRRSRSASPVHIHLSSVWPVASILEAVVALTRRLHDDYQAERFDHSLRHALAILSAALRAFNAHHPALLPPNSSSARAIRELIIQLRVLVVEVARSLDKPEHVFRAARALVVEKPTVLPLFWDRFAQAGLSAAKVAQLEALVKRYSREVFDVPAIRVLQGHVFAASRTIVDAAAAYLSSTVQANYDANDAATPDPVSDVLHLCTGAALCMLASHEDSSDPHKLMLIGFVHLLKYYDASLAAVARSPSPANLAGSPIEACYNLARALQVLSFNALAAPLYERVLDTTLALGATLDAVADDVLGDSAAPDLRRFKARVLMLRRIAALNLSAIVASSGGPSAAAAARHLRFTHCSV